MTDEADNAGVAELMAKIARLVEAEVASGAVQPQGVATALYASTIGVLSQMGTEQQAVGFMLAAFPNMWSIAKDVSRKRDALRQAGPLH